MEKTRGHWLGRWIEPKTQVEEGRKLFSDRDLKALILPLFIEQALAMLVGVADTGSGIPAEAIARVVEPFYMVDKSRARKSGGSGLGLALCQRIAEAHGSKLQIRSKLGSGTVVTVLLQPTAAGEETA